MFFTAPFLHLAFFAFAAIPVIIYLIFRRRKKDVSWGSMYILRRLLETKSKVNLWKQYLILALRTLALILLVLLFLWPLLAAEDTEEGTLPQPPISTHRLVLMDTSESMNARFGSGSAFDAAGSFVRKALAAGVAPGRVDILPLDGRSEALTFTDGPLDEEAINRVLANLERPEPVADIVHGLRQAVQTFRASHYRHKELFVLTDFSRSDFADLPAVTEQLEALKAMGVRIFGLSYANDEATNTTIVSMTPEMDVLLAGQPTLFYTTVGYFGSATSTDTWLTITNQDDQVLYEETISLAPGLKTLEIPLALPAGRQVITATLREDDLASDNSLTRSFDVRRDLRLVIAQDINLTEGFENPRAWLKLALGEGARDRAREEAKAAALAKVAARQGGSAPSTAAGPAEDEDAGYLVDSEYINTTQINPSLLEGRDGVIVVDVDQASEDSVEALRRYAMRGGTVLLAPGPTVDASQFNETFAPLLPMPLGPPVRESVDPDAHDAPVLEAADTRLWRELESTQHGDLSSSRFYNHYAADPDALAADSDLVFALTDGHALLARRMIGRGKVLLWTAGMGMDWQSMVVHPAYPVFFSRLFNKAAAEQRFELNLAPGDPIIADVETNEVILETPAGSRETLTASKLGERMLIRYDATQQAGPYRLFDDPEAEQPFATFVVRGQRPESDYRPLDGEAIAALEVAGDARVFKAEAPLVDAVAADYPGRSITSMLALAMLGLIVLEAGLAWRWFG